jgi:hypothetical protein
MVRPIIKRTPGTGDDENVGLVIVVQVKRRGKALEQSTEGRKQKADGRRQEADSRRQHVSTIA